VACFFETTRTAACALPARGYWRRRGRGLTSARRPDTHRRTVRRPLLERRPKPATDARRGPGGGDDGPLRERQSPVLCRLVPVVRTVLKPASPGLRESGAYVHVWQVAGADCCGARGSPLGYYFAGLHRPSVDKYLMPAVATDGLGSSFQSSGSARHRRKRRSSPKPRGPSHDRNPRNPPRGAASPRQ